MTREIIAILRGVRPDDVEAHAAALIAAGVTTIEVPLNSPEPFESVARLVARFDDVARIGAGTVLDPAEVDRLASIGARLIVSPNVDPAVIRATRARGLESYPGALSPTECFTALAAGASALKFFPGTLIGPAGLAAVRAVLPAGTRLLAVGGASAENFADWVAAGATGFGIGAALYRPGQAPEITGRNAREIVAAYDAAMAGRGA